MNNSSAVITIGQSGISGFSGNLGNSGFSGFSGTEGPTGGGVTWSGFSSNYSITSDRLGILADTSVGSWTLTLPPSPSEGDLVAVADITSSFAENNLTVARNGNLIQGTEDDILCDINQMAFELVYSGPEQGWMLNPYADEGAGVSMPRGYIDGLILSNNTGDANNDIDISPGSCRDSTDQVDIILDSGTTKQLDAAFAEGVGAGGLDTGSKANSTWYHVFAIKRLDTGDVDALFSASATDPTMPSNYTAKRRIGAVMTNGSGNILAFVQEGDEFIWDSAKTDVSAAATPNNSKNLATMTVPTGIRVLWRGRHSCVWATASATTYHAVLDGDYQGTTGYRSIAACVVDTFPGYSISEAWTNTSGQIRHYSEANTGTCSVYTNGWIDQRGKNSA